MGPFNKILEPPQDRRPCRIAIMEQMEQLFPHYAMGHLCNSPRSEIFMGRGEQG